MRTVTSFLFFVVISFLSFQIINAQQTKDISKLYIQIQDGYVLDSVKFSETSDPRFNTYHFQYNEDGKMIRNDCGYYIFKKKVDGKWVNLKVPVYYNYYYNINGQVDHVDLEYFDSVWVDRGKYIFSYDVDGRLISKIYGNKIDGTDSVMANLKEIYEYSSNGNLIYYLNSKLYGSVVEWSTYEYDSLNRLKLRKDFSGIDSSDYYKHSYNYDSLGNIYYSYKKVTEGLENEQGRRYLEISESGKLILDQNISFRSYDSTWRDFSKAIYEYDGNGNILSVSRALFYTSGVWGSTTKYIAHIYNSDGNLDSLNYGLWGDQFYDFLDSKSPILYDSFGNSIPLDCWNAKFYYSKLITGVEQNNSAVKDFQLYQNYPNPFNPATVISYQLSVISNVELKIYDVLGKEVAVLVNEEKAPGYYEVNFDAGKYNLSSGVYFYRINAGEFTSTRKLIIMK